MLVSNTRSYRVLRTLSCIFVLLGANFLYAGAANSEPATVYKSGKRLNKSVGVYRIVPKKTPRLQRLNRNLATPIADVPELAGGPGGKAKRRVRKLKPIQYCNLKNGQTCVSRGSQIIQIPRRKN